LHHQKEYKNNAYGIDLSEYHLNLEWDVMQVTASEPRRKHSCCSEPYSEIFFSMRIRRKTLFYLTNLLLPCFGLALFALLVFFLPSESGEKVKT
jgi:hypothetical protein